MAPPTIAVPTSGGVATSAPAATSTASAASAASPAPLVRAPATLVRAPATLRVSMGSVGAGAQGVRQLAAEVGDSAAQPLLQGDRGRPAEEAPRLADVRAAPGRIVRRQRA